MKIEVNATVLLPSASEKPSTLNGKREMLFSI